MDWTPFRGIPDPALVVMCGAPGSGKSTVASFWPGQVVSSDQLRLAIAGPRWSARDNEDVFTLVHQITDMRLRRGLRTVVDATSVTREHRAPLLALAAQAGVPAVAVVCWPPLQTCLDRNAVRRPRRVPEEVIRSQYTQLMADMPTRSEGFARVIVTGGEFWLAQAAASLDLRED